VAEMNDCLGPFEAYEQQFRKDKGLVASVTLEETEFLSKLSAGDSCPKLQELQNKVMGCSENSRVIVFVESQSSASDLTRFLRDQPWASSFNPDFVVGKSVGSTVY
jgi:ERCC4-related helicase